MTIENFLTDEEHAAFEKHCKGCQFFKLGVKKKDICNIIAWTADTHIEYVLKYAENCPCVKCLVKAACTETICNDWRCYVIKCIEERDKNEK
jgi:hypothetical protein